MMWVEGIALGLSFDMGGAIGAKDVEGEGAEPGEVARFGSNAAQIFEEGDVADVVAAVFDAPVLADRRTGGGRGQSDLAGIDGYLVGLAPKTGLGVLVPGEAGDAGGGDDQAVPVGCEAAGDIEGLDQTMLLSAMPVALDALGAVGGRLGGADRAQGFVEDLLVGFDLGDQETSRIAGGLKRFFDSAWHRR